MTTTCIRIYVTTGHPESAAKYAYSKKSSSIAQHVDRFSKSFNFKLFWALWTWSYTAACLILLIQATRISCEQTYYREQYIYMVCMWIYFILFNVIEFLL